jgi:hypothetical protein
VSEGAAADDKRAEGEGEGETHGLRIIRAYTDTDHVKDHTDHVKIRFARRDVEDVHTRPLKVADEKRGEGEVKTYSLKRVRDHDNHVKVRFVRRDDEDVLRFIPQDSASHDASQDIERLKVDGKRQEVGKLAGLIESWTTAGLIQRWLEVQRMDDQDADPFGPKIRKIDTETETPPRPRQLRVTPTGPHAATIRARIEAVLNERDRQKAGSKITKTLSMPPATFDKMLLKKVERHTIPTRQEIIKKGLEEVRQRIGELGYKLQNQTWEDKVPVRKILPPAFSDTTAMDLQKFAERRRLGRDESKPLEHSLRPDILVTSLSHQLSTLEETTIPELADAFYAALNAIRSRHVLEDILEGVAIVDQQVEMLQDELLKILQGLSASVLAARVNRMAAEAYVSHTLLRSSLGGMILGRAEVERERERHSSSPSPSMAVAANTGMGTEMGMAHFDGLVTKLQQLRTFEQNLFYSGSGSASDDASMHLDVKERLDSLEMRDPAMRPLQNLDQFLEDLQMDLNPQSQLRRNPRITASRMRSRLVIRKTKDLKVDPLVQFHPALDKEERERAERESGRERERESGRVKKVETAPSKSNAAARRPAEKVDLLRQVRGWLGGG